MFRITFRVFPKSGYYFHILSDFGNTLLCAAANFCLESINHSIQIEPTDRSKYFLVDDIRLQVFFEIKTRLHITCTF